MKYNLIELIKKFDNILSDYLYEKFKNNIFVSFISYIGSIYFVVFYFVMIIFLSSERTMAVLFTALSFFISTFFVFVLKFSIKRKRRLPGSSPFLRELDPYSFPSGHVTRVTALFAPFYENILVVALVLFLGLLVSVTRVAKGFHYPSDCAAGIAIGFISSYLSYLFIIAI